MHDLVVRGGTVVDGTGHAARTADVAVDGGRITAVGDLGGAAAHRGSTPTALLVTPGWVDIHTHYDGQATWDEVLAPSAWHGVTTVVTGNCGVGFAPARPDRHDWLIGLMEGVEDIPGTALAEGMTLGLGDASPSTSTPSDAARWTVDVGTQIAHGAVRAYVMGERGARNEPANPDDIAAMKRHGQGGHRGRRARLLHLAHHRPPWPSTASRCPGTFAAEDELFGIGARPRRAGHRGVRAGPDGRRPARTSSAPAKEVDWMRRLSAAIGRPVTFALLQVDAAPDLWRELMDESLRAADEGAELWPQVAGRATGLLSGHYTTYSPVRPDPRLPGSSRPGTCADDELVAALRDPAVRACHRVVGARRPITAPRMEQAYARHLRPRQPAGLRARARSARWPSIAAAAGRTPARGRLRRHARGRRARAALRPHPQLRLDGNLEPDPRDAAAPPRRRRPGRRRRPLRRDLRRRASPRSCSRTGPATAPGASGCRSSGW